MSRAGMVRAAIGRIGSEVSLLRDGEVISFTASIQPRFTKAGDESTSDGYCAPVCYEMFSAADTPPLAAGDTILSSHAKYTVLQTEIAFLQGEALYRHTLLREEEVL